MSFHAMRFFRVVVFNHIFGFWCIRRPKLHALLHFLRLIIFDWEFSVRFFNAHRRAAVKKIPDLRMEQCRSLYASEAKDTIKCHYSEESYCMEGGPWASFFLSFNHWWVITVLPTELKWNVKKYSIHSQPCERVANQVCKETEMVSATLLNNNKTWVCCSKNVSLNSE